MSALIPAAAGATVGLLWAASGDFPPILVTAILIAVGISLTAADRVTGRDMPAVAGGYLMIVLCGCLLGVSSGRSGAMLTSTRLPVADHRLTGLVGTVLGFSGRDKDIILLDLELAKSESIQGSASGPAQVRPNETGNLLMGERISVELSSGTTRPWRDESGRLWIQADAVVGALPAGETGFGNALRYAFGAMRGRIHRSIGNTIHVVAGRAAPLLLALILGEAGEIDPRVNLLFRRAGAVHLLALSGMHLAVIALLVRALVRPLAGPAVAGWTAVAAGLFYVALAGPRPGLVRAFILIALSTLFRSVDHRRPLIELLAATFLIQLVLQPGAASSLGFQLSYLSLLGIALLATQLGGLVGQHVPPALASPLAAGAGAQLFTAPLLLSRFGSWYPVGIVSSAVMGPLVLVVMTVGIVAVVLYSAGLRMIVPVVRPLLESLSDTATAMSWFFSGSPAVHPSGSLRYWVVAASALAGMVCAMGLRNTYRGRT